MSDLRHGRLNVGLEALPICLSAKLFKGLLLYAPDSNGSGVVYIGCDTVSAADSEQQGIPLRAGMHLEIPCDDGARVFAVGDDSGLKLHWMSI